MPIFPKTVTVPANTPSTSPFETTVKLEGDVLIKVILLIPAGHMALTGIQVLYGTYRLIPRGDEAWLSGDDERLEWPEYIELPERETTLKIRAYNTDTVYNHTFYIRFVTTYKKWIMPTESMARAYKLIERLLGRLLGRM